MKYILTIEHSQKGVVFKTEKIVVESSRKIRVGEATRRLCDPPIDEIAVKVEEACPVCNGEGYFYDDFRKANGEWYHKRVKCFDCSEDGE
jgi:predicted methyltransferase